METLALGLFQQSADSPASARTIDLSPFCSDSSLPAGQKPTGFIHAKSWQDR